MKKTFKILCFILMCTPSMAYGADDQREAFVVISGLSTGTGIAPALRGYGYDVIHVESNLQKGLEGYHHKKYDYVANFKESSDPKQLLEEIKKIRKIKGIIVGAEAGVDLGEKLNAIGNMPYRNNPELSNTRRNKYHMQEALKKAKVPSINQYLAQSLSQALEWQEKNKVEYPMVLKPVESAGTDNVFICNTKNEVEQAFTKITTSLDIYKNPNKEVLCQEYIGGQEYMVNTVSFDGEHRIIEVLKINKSVVNGKPLYDTLELLHPQHEDFKIINQYLARVYQALGLNYGAGHAEVKVWSKDNKKQATLIEVAVRLGGASSPSALQKVQDYSQLSALVKSYIDADFLKTLPKEGMSPKQEVSAVFFIAKSSGNVKKDLDLEFFKKLKTYHSLHFSYKKGDMLPKTTDLMNCPGYVYLVGTKSDIEQDVKAIRGMEENLFSDMLS